MSSLKFISIQFPPSSIISPANKKDESVLAKYKHLKSKNVEGDNYMESEPDSNFFGRKLLIKMGLYPF
jgi:hypothetical protein